MRRAIVLGLFVVVAAGAYGCEGHTKAAQGAANSGGDVASGGAAGGVTGSGGYDVTVGTGAACGNSVAPDDSGIPSALHWCSSGPLVAPIPNEDHPILSVKDPSVVYLAIAGTYSRRRQTRAAPGA
ncbi:MAG: hypothetical protein QM756_25310 [Polyangiaceae bacterium]